MNTEQLESAWQERVSRTAHGIRVRVLEHTVRNNGGYLSQACSSAEILSALYLRIMALGPVPGPLEPRAFAGVPRPGRPGATGAGFNGPRSSSFDRFILSPSQYSLVLYALLVETGRMASDGLLQFNVDGGTVEMIGAEHSPGMEVMSGSLGQGISQAGGIALARRLRADTGKVWLFMSDGEFQIGQTWEALQAISYHGLDNVCIVIDVNGYQCDGPTKAVMNVEPLGRRLESFGAVVRRVDGHDIGALAAAAGTPHDGRPLAIVADTCPYRGMELLRRNEPKFHYVRFRSGEERDEYARLLEDMRHTPEGRG